MVGEVVGDPLVAPALIVQLIYLSHNDSLGRFDLKRHRFGVGDHIAVGDRADPFAVLLPPFDDVAHLFGGVSDGHLVHQKVDLYPQPVVIGGVIDVVADGNDAYPLVAQGFQFYQARSVSSGEAREVFDYQNVVLITEQLAPHFLVALALFKGIAALVPVLVEVELRVWEVGFNIVLNDSLLVFNRGIFLVQLIVY